MENGHDVLVVGSDGSPASDRLHEVLVGSVAAGCIRAADCAGVILPAPHLPALKEHELEALSAHSYHPGPMY